MIKWGEAKQGGGGLTVHIVGVSLEPGCDCGEIFNEGRSNNGRRVSGIGDIYMLENIPSIKLLDATLFAIPWGYQSRTLCFTRDPQLIGEDMIFGKVTL